MTNHQSISPAQGRKLALLYQGVHKKSALAKGKAGTLEAINKLGYIQIDTISVVERAHHHVLNSRVHGYKNEFLDELQCSKDIFEYWSHAAAYLPINDFRFSLPKKKAIANGEKHWYEVDKKLKRKVFERVKLDGPLQARDFEGERRIVPGGWDWKPAKRALEQLYMEGELMISHRLGFQKVYDLTERVLPASVNTKMPDEFEYHQHLILKYLQAHGFGKPAQFCYLRKGIKAAVEQCCQQMCEDGTLIKLKLNDEIYVALPEVEELLSQSLSRQAVEILSPFDNLLIQRQRTRDIFAFDYQIECYVPQAKRRFGYFVLPIVWGHGFAGRMDAKVDRKTGVLTVKDLYIETPNKPQFLQALEPALERFRKFNNAHELKIENVHETTV